MGQKLKTPLNRLFFKIIAETPIAEHLKKSVVRIVANFVYVYGANALLRIGHALARWVLLTHEVRHKRKHAGHGEQDTRVIFRHERGRRYNLMAF